jgi:hypothetical protein
MAWRVRRLSSSVNLQSRHGRLSRSTLSTNHATASSDLVSVANAVNELGLLVLSLEWVGDAMMDPTQ